jgi:hypothetical protein
MLVVARAPCDASKKSCSALNSSGLNSWKSGWPVFTRCPVWLTNSFVMKPRTFRVTSVSLDSSYVTRPTARNDFRNGAFVTASTRTPMSWRRASSIITTPSWCCAFVTGTSVMPQSGHFPGPGCLTDGCIGHV